MSLQKDFTDPTIAGGADFPTAIFRIDHLNIPDLNADGSVNLGIYVDQTRLAAGRSALLIQTVPITNTLLTTANPTFVANLQARIASGAVQTPKDALLAAIYTLLKLQPAFAGAIDV